MLVAVFPEFLRNGFGAITTVAFNHTQIAILIFSDNRKLSLGHDVLPSWFNSFPIRARSARKPPIRADSDRHFVCAVNGVVECKLTHYRRTYRRRRQSHALQTDPHKGCNNACRQECLRAFHASSFGRHRAHSRVTNG
jgi:hypothetical protein